MALKQPESMDECVYFTRRTIGKGNVMAWIFKEKCPKCGKAMMGKPVEKGKVKIRAKEYVCPACNYTVPKQEYEETLTVNVAYTCPHCSNKGETQTPFKRKTFEGAKAIVFQCEKCKQKIPITKKMKKTGKKEEEGMDEE